MILIATESGSVYEIDYETRSIRRVAGSTPVHHSFGEDGVWKVFEEIDHPCVGERLRIVWDSSQGWKGTVLTSRVIRVEGQAAA